MKNYEIVELKDSGIYRIKRLKSQDFKYTIEIERTIKNTICTHHTIYFSAGLVDSNIFGNHVLLSAPPGEIDDRLLVNGFSDFGFQKSSQITPNTYTNVESRKAYKN